MAPDTTSLSAAVSEALQQIRLPDPQSHKGQNGKLLIIGGSELFHAASKWSLDVASKFVDMVFYSSVPENNELVKEAKQNFWNGIVIARSEIEQYIAEADCVLIGPGMTRSEDTAELTNSLLKKYPDKKWVIDAGALQMADHKLLNEKMIITPHQTELGRLLERANNPDRLPCTVLLKGHIDTITGNEKNRHQTLTIEGGNAGMTKGGTGDVLAGLVAALYCTHDAWTAAVVGSYVNKKAGDILFAEVGPYFNASDLVEAVPRAMWQALQPEL